MVLKNIARRCRFSICQYVATKLGDRTLDGAFWLSYNETYSLQHLYYGVFHCCCREILSGFQSVKEAVLFNINCINRVDYS